MPSAHARIKPRPGENKLEALVTLTPWHFNVSDDFQAVIMQEMDKVYDVIQEKAGREKDMSSLVA